MRPSSLPLASDAPLWGHEFSMACTVPSTLKSTTLRPSTKASLRPPGGSSPTEPTGIWRDMAALQARIEALLGLESDVPQHRTHPFVVRSDHLGELLGRSSVVGWLESDFLQPLARTGLCHRLQHGFAKPRLYRSRRVGLDPQAHPGHGSELRVPEFGERGY